MTTSKRDSHDKARRAGSQPNLGQRLTGENRGSGWIDTTGESVKRAKARLAELESLLTEKGSATISKPYNLVPETRHANLNPDIRNRSVSRVRPSFFGRREGAATHSC